MTTYLSNDDLKIARSLHAGSINALENAQCYESGIRDLTHEDDPDTEPELLTNQAMALLTSIAYSLAARNAIALGSPR